MGELLTSVVQNGFSVAVAAYLLVRMEKRLEELSRAIRDLHGALVAAHPAESRGDRSDELAFPSGSAAACTPGYTRDVKSRDSSS